MREKKYDPNIISLMLKNGRTLEDIGHLHGVSRQRMYQVITALKLATPIKQRKRQSDTWSVAQRWLWKILCHRYPADQQSRLDVFNRITLPTFCPVLGIPINYAFDKGARQDDSPSLDRINSDLPYTPTNVHVISWRANRIKNNGTPDEHLKIYEYFKNKLNNL